VAGVADLSELGVVTEVRELEVVEGVSVRTPVVVVVVPG